MKKLLTVAALGELATGVTLLVVPALVGRLLFGEELTGVAVPVARVLGIALVALSVACWPGGTALCGMLTYSTAATAYLTWLSLRGVWVGPVLWPAVGLHAVLTILLGQAWLKNRKGSGLNNHPGEK